MDAWEKYEQLKDLMGADELLHSFALAMSTDELEDYCDYVARMNDVEFDKE